jgi:hypothetical protein
MIGQVRSGYVSLSQVIPGYVSLVMLGQIISGCQVRSGN